MILGMNKRIYCLTITFLLIITLLSGTVSASDADDLNSSLCGEGIEEYRVFPGNSIGNISDVENEKMRSSGESVSCSDSVNPDDSVIEQVIQPDTQNNNNCLFFDEEIITSEGTGPKTANIRWNTTPLSGDADTPPLIADGKVFVSTWWTTNQMDDYYLYCYNQSDGTFLWKNTLASGIGSYLASAATGGGRIFVRGINGVLYAVDMDTGVTKWTKTLDTSPLWWSQTTSSPVVSGDYILAVSQTTGILRKFDFSGNEIKTFNGGGTLEHRSSPVVSDGDAYFAAGDSLKLFSINFETFEENWNFVSSEKILSSPVIGTDALYFTTSSYLYALNKSSGEELWIAAISSPSGAGTPAFSDGHLYVGEKDGLHKYSSADGSEVWHYSSASIAASPAIAENGVYFATNEKAGKVICLNPDDGTLIWEYTQAAPAGGYFAAFWGSSPVIDNEKLYIGGAYYNTLYCFGKMDDFSWSGDVTLEEGPDFKYSPTNNPSADYNVNAASDLAALKKASEKGGFEYYTDDSSYPSYNTFELTGIGGINQTDDLSYCWSEYINGERISEGLAGNILRDGDLLQFAYGFCDSGKGIYPAPDNSDNSVNITVSVLKKQNKGPKTSNIRWNTASLSGDVETPPVIADGKVFFSTWWTTNKMDDYYLYCYNQSDGSYLWKNTLANNVSSYLASPASGGGNVYVRGTDGVLYAVDMDTGKTNWTKTLDNSPQWWSQATSSPVVSGDYILAVSQTTGILRKFDFEGNEVKTFNGGGTLEYRSSPVVSGEYIYFAAGDSQKLYSLNFETFEENWNFISPEKILSSPVMGTDSIYFTTSSNLYAINKSSGEELWSTAISSPNGAGTPSFMDGHLYAGEKDGLHKYSAADGSEEWHYSSASIAASPAIAENGIYFATNEKAGKVVCVNPDDGTLIWEYAQAAPAGNCFAAFWGSSPVIDNEMLYIGGAYYDTLYCFGPEMPLGEPHLYASPKGGKAPVNVSFSATGCENAKRFVLDFGDGSDKHISGSLSGVSVLHTYTNVSEYTAKLTAYNSDETESRSCDLKINVITAPVNKTAENSVSANVPGVNISVSQPGIQDISINLSGWEESDGVAGYTKPDGTEVTIQTGNYTKSGDVLSGEVTSVTISSPGINGSEISPDVGNASVNFNFTMGDYQENATVETTISPDVVDDAKNAFSVACTDSNLVCDSIAYTVYFTKSGFTNDSSVSGVNLSFTVKNTWIDSQGGISDVRIIRWKDDGESEVLSPFSYDISGNYTRLYVYSDGFSVYGLIMAHSNAPSPTPTTGGGGGGGSSLTYTPVTLSSGTFEVTATNSGKVYDVDICTALGILHVKGISFVVDDGWYAEYGTLFVKSVQGEDNEGNAGWMYQVNGNTGNIGANVFKLNNGDEVLWYYSESMESVPEESAQKIALKASISSSASGSSGSSGGGGAATTSGGNVLAATGSVDLAIGLPEDSSLTLEGGRMYFSIDIQSAKSSGEVIVQDKNSLIITRGDLTLKIRFKDYKVRDGVTSGEIESISISTAPVIKNSGMDAGVKACLDMEMNSIPVDGQLILSIPDDVDSEEINRLLKSSGTGKVIGNAVYELDAEKENIENGVDVASATVYMTVPEDLLSSKGELSEFRIVHILDDGGAEIITPEILNDDEPGLVTFKGISQNGVSSSFVLATITSESKSSGQAGEDNLNLTGEENNAEKSGSYAMPVFAVLAVLSLAAALKYNRR
ncbi:outer membrane protein assembly factor BamB family protein [Methanoplanus endosymbiosus]|uniref:PQQ-binding-like beta-propeller repeat protein n=1 Tax=Methanoplanus endosymbiosus TaxID=33865 RepID=A0A9E7PPL4_9EURY|nr:PQQ-binding-like beta-propeller repeat protein [Methanoplanus endosymbiosus]UUX92711.1 PQQ-binding-like beta-propeller repeat protein [Methanoplanus endosymbiosus]